MRSRTAWLLTFLVFAFAKPGLPATVVMAAGQAQPIAEEDEAQQQVRKLSTQEVDAFLHRDPEAMRRLWADSFVVTNPLNKFATKQQVLGMMTSGFLVITEYKRDIEYIKDHGDTVIVAGSEDVVWGGRMPNAGKSEHLRFTAVWMRHGGTWREVARHANVVPAQ